MNIFWGFLMVAIGIFMLICGLKKCDFIIYRILVARSKILWGENVHRFYQIAGFLIIIFGILMLFGVWN